MVQALHRVLLLERNLLAATGVDSVLPEVPPQRAFELQLILMEILKGAACLLTGILRIYDCFSGTPEPTTTFAWIEAI